MKKAIWLNSRCSLEERRENAGILPALLCIFSFCQMAFNAMNRMLQGAVNLPSKRRKSRSAEVEGRWGFGVVPRKAEIAGWSGIRYGWK